MGGAVIHKGSGKAQSKGQEGSVRLRIPSFPGCSLRGSNRALKGRVSLGLPTLPTSEGHLQPPKKEDAVEPTAVLRQLWEGRKAKSTLLRSPPPVARTEKEAFPYSLRKRLQPPISYPL